MYFELCDISADSDLDKVSRVLEDTDAVFFKAGVLGNAEKAVDPDYGQSFFDVNCYSLLNLLERCEDRYPPHILIDSSIAAVATKGTTTPATEKETYFQPMNFYGLSKLALEKFAEFIQREAKCKVTIFRYPRVYAPGVRNVIWNFIYSVIRGCSIIVTGDPKKVIDFVHLDDVVDANIRALKLDSDFELLHVTAGEPVQLIDLANTVIEKYGTTKHKIIVRREEKVPVEPTLNCLEDNYTRNLLKMDKPIGINQMIEQTYNLISETVRC